MAIEWQFRPYREGDEAAIMRLLHAIEAHDHLGEIRTEGELESRFHAPGVDPEQSVVLVEGPRLPGVPDDVPPAGGAWSMEQDEGQGFRDYILRMWTHPTARAEGVERALFARLVSMVRENEARLGPAPRPVSIFAGFAEQSAHRRQLLEEMGLMPERVFFKMERDLSLPIDEPDEVEGITFRTYNRPEDNPGARAAYNESFQDHWDHHDETQEEWDHTFGAPSRRPDLSWLAEVDGAPGTFGGFCLVVIHSEENEVLGVKEGWIELLGTTRAWRGKGVGKSLLLRGLRSLKEEGMDTALLGVDSTSPTGADKLYFSVGFKVRRADHIYKAPLDEVRV